MRETMGVSADGSSKAFRRDDIDSFFLRVPDRITYNPRNPTQNTDHFFVVRLYNTKLHSECAVLSCAFPPGGRSLWWRLELLRRRVHRGSARRGFPGEI